MALGVSRFGSLGLCFALLLERLNSTFRTSEEVEETTGLPVLSVVPRFGSSWRFKKASREILDQPPVRVTEALLSLSIGLAGRGFGTTANRCC